MTGIFAKQPIRYFSAIFFFVVGTLIAIKCGVWGIDAVNAEVFRLAPIIFFFGFALLGVACGGLAIILFNFNRKAYLEVDDKTLKAKFGFDQEISLPLDKIIDVKISVKMLAICTKEKEYEIAMLENAFDIGRYIKKSIPSFVEYYNAEQIQIDQKKNKRKLTLTLVLTATFLILMFASVILSSFLTGGRDFSDFTRQDDIIFLIFSVVFVLSLICSMIFANISGKSYKRHDNFVRVLVALSAHKNIKLGLPDEFMIAYGFDDMMKRIVVFETEKGFAYTLEDFTPDGTWISFYSEPQEYETREDLEFALDWYFENCRLEIIEKDRKKQ